MGLGVGTDLPELPDRKKQRYIDDMGLSAYDAGVLVAEKEIAGFFEAVAQGRDAKVAANWVQGEFFGRLSRAGHEVGDSPVSAHQLGGLIDLIGDNVISGRIAKDVLDEMFQSGRDAADIVKDQGLEQVSDSGALAAEVDKVIAANPDRVAEFKGGKEKIIGWFVGQVMQATQGKANPQMVNQLLREKLTD